jgi:putative ABC transport system substrate-binding protein
VEGKNITIEYRFAEGKLERLPDLAVELVRFKVDVIVAAGGTPAILAAKNATSTIPIVFPAVSDPVALGIVASLARPGGNVTGLTIRVPEFSGKRLELLKEVVPGLGGWLFSGRRQMPPTQLISKRCSRRPRLWAWSFITLGSEVLTI